MQDRQALHTLVDELPEPELAAAKRFLESLRSSPPTRCGSPSTPPLSMTNR